MNELIAALETLEPKNKKKWLGSLEESLLWAILQLETEKIPSSGALIQLRLAEWGRDSSLGTIHSSLNNLERAKLVAREQKKAGGKCLWLTTKKGIEELGKLRDYHEKVRRATIGIPLHTAKVKTDPKTCAHIFGIPQPAGN